ncbi:MAG: hypothetical protein ABFR31_12255 [Thermodesulfobacteriota bacterium]
MDSQVIKQNTGTDSILVFVFAIGVMLSPDTLVMLGNFFGKTGNIGFFLIIFSATIYFTLISQYKQLFIFPSDDLSDIDILKTAMGAIPAFFPFFVKTIVVVFLSTGLFVSSGFVFNEVFLYWFPNFGFAFVLLGLLLGLQFLPDKAILYLQIGFCAIPIFGLLILIIAGIIQADQFVDFKLGDIDYSIDSLGLGTLFLPLLLFIGFDLGFNIVNKSEQKPLKNSNILFIAVIFMGMLFLLWGYVLLLYVPVGKLIDTSIPHMIAAKSILGDPGRFIMGGIVISGSLAAVHALFTTVSKQGSILFKIDKLPGNIKISKIIILSLTLIIAGMMAGGLAGEDQLETFIRASFILWLILYAMISISHILTLGKPAKRYHNNFLLNKTVSVMCLFILGITILILTILDDKPILIFKFLGVALFISLIPAVLLRLKENKLKN